jgi:negative regulator of flagellin synthesis FlgM
MPSVEPSKLQAIGAARALSESERAQLTGRADALRNSAAAVPAPAAGISVEIAAALDTATPPVDAERVEQIRAALRDGSYPLVPTKIADAMIAAQVSLVLPDLD